MTGYGAWQTTFALSTLSDYVVAIAATNPALQYDWEVEDFAVSKVKSWTDALGSVDKVRQPDPN